MNKSSLSLQYWIMSELHLEKQVLHVSNFVSVCKHYHSSKVNLVIFYKEDQAPSLQSAFAVGMWLRLIWVFLCQVRLRAVSLFLENPLSRPEERKTRKYASVTVSVTFERRCCEPLIGWALGDERQRRHYHSHAPTLVLRFPQCSRKRETARSLMPTLFLFLSQC